MDNKTKAKVVQGVSIGIGFVAGLAFGTFLLKQLEKLRVA